MQILISIGAVVLGFITVAVLSTATDYLLAALGFFPSITAGAFAPWMLGIALLYRIAYTVLGGYLTALAAPRRPMLHVVVLGVLGTLAGIGGVIAGWHLGNVWYPIAIAVTGFPAVWLGGYFRTRDAKNA